VTAPPLRSSAGGPAPRRLTRAGLGRRLRAAALAGGLAAAALLAGCGSGASGPTAPTIAPARTFALAGFTPARPVIPGRPVTLSFSIRQPDGTPLTRFKRGPGPHTGVHLIIVRQDLGLIIHRHPPIGPEGRISQTITFPTPGPYHVLVDVYPDLPDAQLRNFQLTRNLRVSGPYRPQPLPAFAATDEVDGYRFALDGRPRIRAFQATFLTAIVTDPAGRPVRFSTWYGALAHAVFFHERNLDYFHTHVCAPGASGCTSVLGAASVSGSSARPGVLRVGVLLPEAGTWRLFLQIKAGGRILTAPYTLRAR
jgi:hypothetical protein